ncbi:MAG: CCA tRNA nucleotidyltransferase [Lachnospirales bacterium]
MKLPKNVEFVLNTLQKEGYEAYVVGGAVRDSVMNKNPKDYDITTKATPLEIKNIFKKTIDTGIEHGTVTVVVDYENIEVTTFRIDGEYENNRKPKEVTFTTSLYEDLVRRDFTINALAYNNTVGFVDKFNGLSDIQNKLIRAVGEKERRFVEDSLRIYRGVRFSCQLNFKIEEETLLAMDSKKNLTTSLSVERIRDEFLKSLKGDYPKNLILYQKLDLLKFYDADFSTYFNNNLNEIVNNLQKNIENENYKEDIVLLSICFLYYPIEDLDCFFKKFRIKNTDINYVKNIILCYNTICHINLSELSDIETRKILCKYKNYIKYAVYLYNLNFPIFDLFKKIERNLKMPLVIKDLDINGKDLMALNIKGKDIGTTLEFLLDEVHKNPTINHKSVLIELIQKDE